MSANPSTPEVTRADREIAHEIMHHVRGYAVKLPDDRHWLIDLVARHRLAHSQARGGDELREDFLAQLRRVNTDRYRAWVGDGEDAGILFDAAELGGEVGELLNVVKKLEREARGWRGSRAAPEDFADECADVLICLDKLARRHGVDLAAATIAKFNATSDKVGLPHKLLASTDMAGASVPDRLARRMGAEFVARDAASPKATATASVREEDPDEEARNDAWNEFFNEHLTDGNDGYRAADVIERCRSAFNLGWYGGVNPAFAIARATLATLNSGTAATIGGERA